LLKNDIGGRCSRLLDIQKSLVQLQWFKLLANDFFEAISVDDRHGFRKWIQGSAGTALIMQVLQPGSVLLKVFT